MKVDTSEIYLRLEGGYAASGSTLCRFIVTAPSERMMEAVSCGRIVLFEPPPYITVTEGDDEWGMPGFWPYAD